MGRGIGPVCVGFALASALAAGCSRTGLDVDTLVLRPVTGAPTADAEPGDDGASPSSSGGSDDGEVFTSDDSTDAADLGSDANGGSGDGSRCGPGTCAGCCTAGGECLQGLSTAACGNGGQRCTQCEPERSCTAGGSGGTCG